MRTLDERSYGFWGVNYGDIIPYDPTLNGTYWPGGEMSPIIDGPPTNGELDKPMFFWNCSIKSFWPSLLSSWGLGSLY